MTYGTVSISQADGVAVIELVSDDGLNCYTPEMGEDLVAALRAAAADPQVRAIVLTGRGKIFCAGAHRSVLSGEVGPSGLTIGSEEFITSFAPEFADLPKLTIAAINGPAVGIGMTMSLLCDLRIAVPGAKLRLNFAELGIMPGLGSTARLPQLVGLSRAKRLLLCDRQILSDEALAIGLVDELVEPEHLRDAALKLGQAAAECRGETLEHIKRCLNAAPAAGGVAGALEREAAAAAEMRRAR